MIRRNFFSFYFSGILAVDGYRAWRHWCFLGDSSTSEASKRNWCNWNDCQSILLWSLPVRTKNGALYDSTFKSSACHIISLMQQPPYYASSEMDKKCEEERKLRPYGCDEKLAESFVHDVEQTHANVYLSFNRILSHKSYANARARARPREHKSEKVSSIERIYIF